MPGGDFNHCMSALIPLSVAALQLLKMDHDCFSPGISLSYVPSLLLYNFSPFFSSLFLIFLPVIFYASPAAAMIHDSPGMRACGAPHQAQCAECISPLVAPQRGPQCNHPYVLICLHQEVTSYHPEKEMGPDSSSPATSFPLCSLTVPKLLLPHGISGGEPHSR